MRNILQTLNSRMNKKGIYLNNYQIKESLNFATGWSFTSERRLKEYLTDIVAFHKNDRIYEDNEILHDTLSFLENKKDSYRRKILKLEMSQYKIYFASLFLAISSLLAYHIHSNVFEKWIYITQIGIESNLLSLLSVIGIMIMSFSILLSPIKEILLIKVRNISTAKTLLIEEIVCYESNLLEMQLLQAIKTLEIAKIIKRSNNPKFSEIYKSVDSVKLVSPTIKVNIDNQSKLLRFFVALVLSEAFELSVDQKTFAKVMYKNIKIEGENVDDTSSYKLFCKFLKYPSKAIMDNVHEDFPNLHLVKQISFDD